jgi:hypothetical protein
MSDSPAHASLSVKGLQRLEQVNHEKDFTFIVGDERYRCPSFVAEFLSPRICSLRSQDITIDEFLIETKDPSHQFGLLLSIGLGHDISVSGSDVSFVRSVCGELRNRELFEEMLGNEGGEVQREALKARLNFLRESNESFDWDVGIVASHFYDFSVSDFDYLSRSVLESILRDSRLVVRDEDSVFDVIHRRSSEDLSYFGLLEFVRFEFVSGDCMVRAIDLICDCFENITFGILSSLRNRLTLPVTRPVPSNRFKSWPPFDSKILSGVPEIFSVFVNKTFRLLYRGSRDGFEARTFHSLCNGHKNTVSLILSTNGFIFGGYTPVAWNSRNAHVSDPSLRSFIFTIKNPHNLAAQIFKQKTEDHAITDFPAWGPGFGSSYYCDLQVCDECDSCNKSCSRLGRSYTNDTGKSGNEVLTGAEDFTVKEIEVFEVVDEGDP